jgi:uncharacterized protein (DUF983 family)
MARTLTPGSFARKMAAVASPTVRRYDIGPMDQRPNQSVELFTLLRRRPASVVLWWRALRLRCPACGNSAIFCGWFRMHETCAACGRRFNRGPGYLLGSIYFNYGVTATLIIILYFAMFFSDVLTDAQRLVVLSLFAAGFASWFFRYARALWIAFDERWDPWPNEEEARMLPSSANHREVNQSS